MVKIFLNKDENIFQIYNKGKCIFKTKNLIVEKKELLLNKKDKERIKKINIDKYFKETSKKIQETTSENFAKILKKVGIDCSAKKKKDKF